MKTNINDGNLKVSCKISLRFCVFNNINNQLIANIKKYYTL